MDYGNLLTRAWKITWRWKPLWILGFLVALAQGSSAGNNLSYSFGREDLDLIPGAMPFSLSFLLITLACGVLLLGIALWFVVLIARGALIAGAQQVEEGGELDLKEAWRASRTRFWTLWGIGMLNLAPLLLVSLVGLLVALFSFFNAEFISRSSMEAARWAFFVPLLLCGLPFILLVLLLGLVLGQVRLYAERAAILEELGWLDAFKRGWAILKANLGPTLLFWIFFLFIGMVLGSVLGGLGLGMFAPFLGLSRLVDAYLRPESWLWFPLVCGGLLMTLLGAVIRSVVESFRSVVWTLAYRQFVTLPESDTDPSAGGDESVAEPAAGS